jgi:putative MATE family efflux protein
VNVILVNLLVYGRFGLPALGLEGAGIAYASYMVVGAVLFLFVLFSGRFAVQLELRAPLRLDWQMIHRIVHVGLPAAGEQLLLSGGILMFSRIVTALGTIAFAAHQITTNVTGLAWMPAFGFSLATTALVGQALGKGDPQLAEEYARTARRLVLYLTLTLGAVFFFFGAPIARLYTSDPEAIALAALCMKVGAISLPPGGAYSVLAGGLRGAGDTRWPLYITFVAVWAIRLTLAYLLAVVLGWGLAGIWTGVVCDQVVRTLLIDYRFRTGHWKTISV